MEKLAKVYLQMDEKERNVLDQCTKITNMPATSLLRSILTQVFRETADQIDKKGQLTYTFQFQDNKESSLESQQTYTYAITVDEKSKEIYDRLQDTIPLTQKHFLTYLVMPKLYKIKTDKYPVWR